MTYSRPRALVLVCGLVLCSAVRAAEEPGSATSYLPVAVTEDFKSIKSRMTAAQPAIQKRQADLLAARYDLSDRPAAGVTMARGKPVQAGVRVKLPAGTTWAALADMAPADIRAKDA